MRSRDFPNATRREACELGLKALSAKRDSTLAIQRAKAMKNLAVVAVATFKKAVAVVTRPDKRQGDLPHGQWAFGHLATAAQAGDKLALNELTARGYSQTSNNTFSKLP
jgi:hypothetical protein